MPSWRDFRRKPALSCPVWARTDWTDARPVDLPARPSSQAPPSPQTTDETSRSSRHNSRAQLPAKEPAGGVAAPHSDKTADKSAAPSSPETPPRNPQRSPLEAREEGGSGGEATEGSRRRSPARAATPARRWWPGPTRCEPHRVDRLARGGDLRGDAGDRCPDGGPRDEPGQRGRLLRDQPCRRALPVPVLQGLHGPWGRHKEVLTNYGIMAIIYLVVGKVSTASSAPRRACVVPTDVGACEEPTRSPVSVRYDG